MSTAGVLLVAGVTGLSLGVGLVVGAYSVRAIRRWLRRVEDEE
jgi:hypothetical protein